MDMKDTRLCQSIAQSASQEAGLALDPMTLLVATLLPSLGSLFGSCFGGGATPAGVKAHLEGTYHNGQYDFGTMQPVVHQAMMTARRQGHPIMRDQARVVALKTLDAARTADNDVVQEAMSAEG